jgi:HK97 family phage prohead protease
MPQRIQSMVFSKSTSPSDVNDGGGWTDSAARAWLEGHELSAPDPDETEESLRYRQFDPDQCEAGSFQTLTENLPVGVSAVACDVAEASERFKVGDREIRSSAAEFRVVEAPDKLPILSGYAAVFNKESDPLFFGAREVIRPGAFAESIKNGDDVRLLYNHGPDTVMARTTAGNLTLSEDDVGLKIESTLDPEDFDVKRVLGKVRAGLVTQMSFAFEVPPGGDRWGGTKEKPLRELLRAKLFDVSPATFPAYPQTTVQVRDRMRAILDPDPARLDRMRRRLELEGRRL